VREALENAGYKIKNVSWYGDAFILQNKSKRELTELPIYEQGKIYIQSLASMAPSVVLDSQPGEKILELTAAPGSKTSQIAMMMKREGELIANDNNKIRFFKLKHNMESLGVVNSEGNEPENWSFTLRMEHGAKLCSEFPAYFDKILLDAPCSAEARFIKGEPKTTGYWKEQKIKEMAYKQRQLLFAAWQSLKPGGILVYSTCTFSPEENEMQISRLIERYPEEVHIINAEISQLKKYQTLKSWRGKIFHPEIKKCLRIMPTTEIEGFFIAKVTKK
jgi:16S rRNA (cytosine1407-C5)-methyltransferase